MLKLAVDLLGGIRATVFFVLLLLAIAGGKWWQHKAQGLRIQLDTERAEHAVLLRQLADAKTAADAAIAAKAEAEKAAQKRLQAREKYWREKYRDDPEARAWGAERVPAGVLDGLRP